MGTKHLVSSAQQHTFISVVGGQKYLAKYNVTALEHVPYSPDLSLPDFFLSRSALQKRRQR
jgi:hypothetical protein